MINVKSPCIKNCCLDDKDICLGCYRHLDEILGWTASTDEQRYEILKQAANRHPTNLDKK